MEDKQSQLDVYSNDDSQNQIKVEAIQSQMEGIQGQLENLQNKLVDNKINLSKSPSDNNTETTEAKHNNRNNTYNYSHSISTSISSSITNMAPKVLRYTIISIITALFGGAIFSIPSLIFSISANFSYQKGYIENIQRI